MDTIAKAQAVMTAWDSSMSQARREEERSWHLYLTECHEEDVSYLETEGAHLLDLSDLRAQKILWVSPLHSYGKDWLVVNTEICYQSEGAMIEDGFQFLF